MSIKNTIAQNINNIDEDNLLNQINKIIDENKNYGKNNIGSGKKVNIEYISTNKNEVLDIKNLREAAYVDCLSRIMSFSGYDVTREYCINNNNQIPILEKNLLNKFKKELDCYRINFDIINNNQTIYDDNLIEEALMQLRNTGNCYIEDGDLYLKTTKYGDELDRLLITNDGTYTNFTIYISYYLDKIKRGFDETIYILDNELSKNIKGLKAVLEMLEKNINILDTRILQMIHLIKDKEELKTNKITGKTYTIMDLINEVDINTTRYLLAAYRPNTNTYFDMDLALKQTNDNPMYYIEYMNSIIYSILKKYNKKAIKHNTYITLTSQEAYNILNKLSRFKDVVISACLKKEPHLIADYVYNVVMLFHLYYNKEKIITEDELATSERINLIIAIQIVIENALNLLGIIPREEM